MTKADDGFRVLRRGGLGGGGGLQGGSRPTGSLGQTLWDCRLAPSQETRRYAGHSRRGTFSDSSRRPSEDDGGAGTMNRDISARTLENCLLKSDTLTAPRTYRFLGETGGLEPTLV